MPLPPLVEPAADLTPAQVGRYARHLSLPAVGLVGQRRLRAARILCVGAGGLGSPAALYLAAAGVGTIGIVDADVVDVSNLQRQVLHGQEDLGRPKVDSARDRLLDVNPDLDVRTHPVRLDADNALDLLAGYDVVLDGSDNFATRYLVSDACALLRTPDVWGSVHRFDGQVSVFWIEHGPTYRDLHPAPPPPGAAPSCAEAGVFGALCGVVGSVMATEAIKLVTGIGDPLVGRVLVYEALGMTWRTVRVRPNPDLPPVTRLAPVDVGTCAVTATGAGVDTAGVDTAGVDTAGVGTVGVGTGSTASAVDTAVIGPRELAAMLEARDRGEEDFVLVDVREPYEREIVAIPGSVPVPLERFQDGSALAHLPEGRRIVLHCKSGARSRSALSAVHAVGRTDAVHLDGGVLAWVAEVQPEQPTY